jgi:hypothetical protein
MLTGSGGSPAHASERRTATEPRRTPGGPRRGRAAPPGRPAHPGGTRRGSGPDTRPTARPGSSGRVGEPRAISNRYGDGS